MFFSKILISIVSWRSYKDTVSLVNALVKSVSSEDKIVVIETGGEPYKFPKLIGCDFAVMHVCNKGYAASHAIAIDIMKQGGFDGVLLLNPDLCVTDSCISDLKKCINRTNNSSVLGAPVFNKLNSSLKVEYLGWPVDDYIKKKINHALTNDGLAYIHEVYSVKDIHGCFMYIPSAIVERYGWMDTEYFLYGEENEYLFRLNKNNVPIAVATDLFVVHENGGSFDNEDLKNIREYYRTRNRLYNNLKFCGVCYLLHVNYYFLIKYVVGRYILKIDSFCNNDMNYFNFLGHIHFLLNKRGRTFNPDDYVKE